ncbi:MFS transporter [Mesorhizobium sp. M0029]|uniref:MFS transporter n=1 Tax=Mesorhizobium sp. M0029 TaxID=2956850 RepID=UPI003337F800
MPGTTDLLNIVKAKKAVVAAEKSTNRLVEGKTYAARRYSSVHSHNVAPLRKPVFRSIWISTQMSNLGWLVQTVAISWLMVTISAPNLMVALVQAASTLPAFFSLHSCRSHC